MHQKPFSIRSKLGLCILPFLQGLDDSNDRSARMHFLNDSIGFWGWSQPKFQDHNVGKHIGEISG